MSAPAVIRLRRRAAARPRTLRVALAGCGVVGAELVSIIRRDAAVIEESHGVRLELTRVLVRDPTRVRSVELSPDLVTADLDSFLTTPADVVIEAIGGLDPARRLALATLGRGARFVTANKALVAAEGAKLQSEARARRGRLQFEAAVGGGVPVVRVLREAMGFARPRVIRGILNGTSNFVLTLLERGASYAAAVEEAQRRGLAEADPSRDLDGRDAADKISILGWLAHGVAPGTVPVFRRGLLPDPERLVRDAQAAGGRLRLIAECVAVPGGIFASVEPVIVSAESPLGRTEHEENRVVLDFGWTTPLELSGPGAGGAPTAAALLGDVLRGGTPAAIPGDAPDAARDPRRHCWAISTECGRRDVWAAFEAAGIPLGTCDGLRIHTGPLERERLEPLLRHLEARGAKPLVARLETRSTTAGGAA